MSTIILGALNPGLGVPNKEVAESLPISIVDI